MDYYEIPTWRDYQHYKDRDPPWIKLHFSILSSPTWVMLDDASRTLAIACMLIASRNHGKVPANPDYLRRVAYLKAANFKPLIDIGFLVCDSGCKQVLANDSELTQEESRGYKSTETELLSGKPDDSRQLAKELIDFLNLKAGKAFRHTDANIEPIIARLKEGYTLQDLKTVTVRKCRDWATDEKMVEYLRPATLYNRTKFNQYIGECVEVSE